MRKVFYLIFASALLLTAGCDDQSKPKKDKPAQYKTILMNKAASALSAGAAQLINEDTAIKQEIEGKVGLKFDGDFNVLFKNLNSDTQSKIKSAAKDYITKGKSQASLIKRSIENDKCQVSNDFWPHIRVVNNKTNSDFANFDLKKVRPELPEIPFLKSDTANNRVKIKFCFTDADLTSVYVGVIKFADSESDEIYDVEKMLKENKAVISNVQVSKTADGPVFAYESDEIVVPSGFSLITLEAKPVYSGDMAIVVQVDNLEYEPTQTELLDAIENITQVIPKLQFQIPYFPAYESRDLDAEGGYRIIHYEFGKSDTEIDSLSGFDSNGNPVLINETSAESIPYMVINKNERTDLEGNLIPDFVEALQLDKESDYEDSDNFQLPEKPTKAMTKNSRPSSGPYWKLISFKCTSVSTYEPYWFNGEPEFYGYFMERDTKLKTSGETVLWAGITVNRERYYEYRPTLKNWFGIDGGPREVFGPSFYRESRTFFKRGLIYDGYWKWYTFIPVHKYRKSTKYFSSSYSKWNEAAEAVGGVLWMEVDDSDLSDADVIGGMKPQLYKTYYSSSSHENSYNIGRYTRVKLRAYKASSLNKDKMLWETIN